MKRINTYQEFKDLALLAKSRNQKASNLFLLPNKIEEKISKNSLYYEQLDDCLLLFDDNLDFYRCYFYLNIDKQMQPFECAKDAVIEFPFNNELRGNQQMQIRRINEMGFELKRESSEMLLLKSDAHFDESLLATEFAKADDVEAIYNILSDSFNPLFAFLPKKDELLDLIEKKRIFVIRHNGIQGVLNSDVEKNIAYIRQLAISSKSRGLGYGRLLVNAFIKEYYHEVEKYCHWVDIDNTNAISLYKKFGYNFGIKKANEYVLRRKL